MVKKVRIPSCANPFIVYVNGKKYSYPAGTEQTVPDEVAIIIAQHHEAHEAKYEPPAGTPIYNGEALLNINTKTHAQYNGEVE